MDIKNKLKKLIKPSLKWLHLGLLLTILHFFPDHTLEVLIVLVLLYDVGFEIPGMDRLAEYNNLLRKWILRKFNPRRK